MGFVAYSPLARNLLAAEVQERPTDQRRQSIPRFAEEHWEQNRIMGERLSALAEEKGVSAAQLSMGWLLQKAKVTNPTLSQAAERPVPHLSSAAQTAGPSRGRQHGKS